MEPPVVGQRYELLEQIGSSSWRAADRELERDVLLRMPAAGVGAARLSHPSIVQVFDQGEHEGEPYVVLEYVGGGTLAQRLEGGGIDASTARQVAADVTAALAYAHAQGVAHGSLSAEQVLFDAEGHAKVAGFGGSGEGAGGDRVALADLIALLGVEETDAAAATAADVTAVLEPLPAAPRWKPFALVALGAAALLLVGVAAAFLATGEDASTPEPSTSRGTSTTSTQQETQAPVVPPPATTAEESTASTAATATVPETTAPETTAPSPTTAPPATTTPEPATEPPPPASEPQTTEPPVTTEPPPTTEVPPPTTTG